MKRLLIVPALLIPLFIYLYFNFSPHPSSQPSETIAQVDAVIYKSPNCGCCVSHNAYLNSNDFTTEIKAVGDMTQIKSQYHIPADMQSCHTAVFDNYFVEGHVPIEAIQKLLSEKPDIDGIALPGMPAGSPGMPGEKTEEFIIYALKDGQAQEFMRI